MFVRNQEYCSKSNECTKSGVLQVINMYVPSQEYVSMKQVFAKLGVQQSLKGLLCVWYSIKQMSYRVYDCQLNMSVQIQENESIKCVCNNSGK